MRHYFYYTKDGNGRTVTNCLAVIPPTPDDLRHFARGIAVCNDLDNHTKKIGRNIAKQRAEKALEIGYNLTKPRGFVMAWHDPLLTDLECKFLETSLREEAAAL